ncbi:ferrichrome-iron receptor [Proteus hauseri ATCC 700826]|uniref:Ferrichrome-iron receptor n=1 Tax=Proteus hauseri ATCC 700826 TaxID=1354271 RepID=A0AAJ3HR76_PROHU|nr:TonB-dependent siderophore receptor [Proteus hauseri]OAT45796.1 ferrichrome-iron receptor [Proteus hauseri ATCC 700826]
MNKFIISTIACTVSQALAISGSAADNAEKIVVVAHPINNSEAGAGFVTREVDMGPLGEKKWLDTPYTTNTFTQSMIENQKITSVADILKYNASSQMQARGGMDVGRPQNRGMQGNVVANSRLDGVNIISTTAFPIEMLERIDIISGLTGSLYGPASPSGQFNFIQKRPTLKPLTSINAAYINDGQFKGHLDLGGFIDDNNTFGYRINLVHDEGQGYVAGSKTRRQLISTAFDWNISSDTVLEVNFSDYWFKKMGYPGAFSYDPNVTSLPDAPDPTKAGYGQAFAGVDLHTRTVSSRLKHDFNEDWQISAAVGYQTADRGFRSISNQLSNDGKQFTPTLSVPSTYGRFTVLSNAINLNGRVITGAVSHDLVMATSGYRWDIYSANGDDRKVTLPTQDINNPHRYDDPSNEGFYTGSARTKGSRSLVQSVTLGDTITFNPQWSVMGSLSQNWIKETYYRNNGSHHTEKGLSPTVALMFKPIPEVMTYVSYADSLEEGDSAPNTAKNKDEVLKPYRSEQWEMGVKSQVDALNLNAAIFQLERPFAYVGQDKIFKEQGKQRNRGLELIANGQVTDELFIFTSMTWLDPTLTNTGNAKTENKDVVGVPKYQANLLTEYHYPTLPNVIYSANLHYTGKRAANTTNTMWAKAYTTLDFGARYQTQYWDKRTIFRLNLDNVTNEHYWASIFSGNQNGAIGGANAFLGTPRQISVSVSIEL